MTSEEPENLRSNAENLWPNRLGTAVRARRRTLGLSQRETALLAGVGERLVHELEHGKPSARLDKVVAVLTVLGLQLSLVDGVDGLTVSTHD
jgi:y4mF family transcriptional regulator